MKIFIAEEAGFCFGVKRALRIINQLHERGKGIEILGELIHNRTVLKDLENKGIHCVNSLDEIDSHKQLVIRTHGIPLNLENQIKEEEINFVDASCPLVKKIHTIIERLNRQDTQVIIIGDRKHPEIVAANSYASHAIIINSIPEAQHLGFHQHISVVAQTTLNTAFFEQIISILREKAGEIEIFNTICSATKVRQDAVKRLAPNVDFMVVIGGKNSSNTKKLYEIAINENPNTFHIENSAELNDPALNRKFRSFNSVGITAGASTPPEEIDNVKIFFEKFKIEKERKDG